MMLAFLTQRIPADVGAFFMFFPAMVLTVWSVVMLISARKASRHWFNTFEAALARWMLGDAGIYWLLFGGLALGDEQLSLLQVVICFGLFVLSVDVFRHWARDRGLWTR